MIWKLYKNKNQGYRISFAATIILRLPIKKFASGSNFGTFGVCGNRFSFYHLIYELTQPILNNNKAK